MTTLIDAVRLAVRLEGDGDRLALFITVHGWERYGEPEYIIATRGLEGVELFPRARKAYESALAWFREVLPQGIIEAEGLHEDTGRIGPITKLEWETRYIDFWRNELQHAARRTRKEYPWIKPTAIRADQICAEYRKRLRNRKLNEPPLSWDDARAVILDAIALNGEFIGQTAGAEIVRKKYPNFPMKDAMALVKELTRNDKPGPKGPRKNRSQNRA